MGRYYNRCILIPFPLCLIIIHVIVTKNQSVRQTIAQNLDKASYSNNIMSELIDYDYYYYFFFFFYYYYYYHSYVAMGLITIRHTSCYLERVRGENVMKFVRPGRHFSQGLPCMELLVPLLHICLLTSTFFG
jgi:hypothetical protein